MRLPHSHPRPRMQPRRQTPPGNTGFTLIDCLVYIAALLAVTGVAFASLNRLWSASARLSGSVDDHAGALHTAERWRIDVRAATGPVVVSDDGRACRIPTAGGSVAWAIDRGCLVRKAEGQAATVWAQRVAGCRFAPDPRRHVRAVRCDLTLMKRSEKARRTPVFSIVAVPAAPRSGTP